MGGKGGNDAPQQQIPAFKPQPATDLAADRAAAMQAAQAAWPAPRFNQETGADATLKQQPQPVTQLTNTNTANLGDVMASSINPAVNYATTADQQKAAAASVPSVPLTGGSV